MQGVSFRSLLLGVLLGALCLGLSVDAFSMPTKPGDTPPLNRRQRAAQALRDGLKECSALLVETAKSTKLPDELAILRTPWAFEVFRASPIVRQFASQLLGKPIPLDGITIHDAFLDFTAALLKRAPTAVNPELSTTNGEAGASHPTQSHTHVRPGSLNPLMTAELYAHFLMRIKQILTSDGYTNANDVSRHALELLVHRVSLEFLDALPPPGTTPAPAEEAPPAPSRVGRRFSFSPDAHDRRPGDFYHPDRLLFADLVTTTRPIHRSDALFAREIELMDRMASTWTQHLMAINRHLSEGTKASLEEAYKYLRGQRILVYLLTKLAFESRDNPAQIATIRQRAVQFFINSMPSQKSPLGSQDNPYPGLSVTSEPWNPREMPKLFKEVAVYPDVRRHLDQLLKLKTNP